jgi:hypothetical protein
MTYNLPSVRRAFLAAGLLLWSFLPCLSVKSKSLWAALSASATLRIDTDRWSDLLNITDWVGMDNLTELKKATGCRLDSPTRIMGYYSTLPVTASTHYRHAP